MITVEDLEPIVNQLWTDVLQTSIQFDERALATDIKGNILTACVQIAGSWSGAVTVQCSEESARGYASKMFQVSSTELPQDDVHDTMGEIANMIGGNVKALIPGALFLSLPVVVNGPSYKIVIPRSEELNSFGFTTEDGDSVVVRLLQES